MRDGAQLRVSASCDTQWAMKRTFALIALLLAASCVAPSSERAAEARGTERLPYPAAQSYPRVASRTIDRRAYTGQSRLYADYLIVDKSERLLVAYNRGEPIRVYRGLQFGDAPRGHKRFEGDERTPEGVYTIHTRNPNSSFHLSLRIDYPNRRDRAFAAQYGRSAGGDIFIHGQPNGANRRMRGDWTDGCIALTNAEIEELWQLVPDGTPIEIRP